MTTAATPDALPPAPSPTDPHGFHFARPPLDNPWTWQYVPADLPGRVMLCAWPAERESAGKDGAKIILPEQAQKRLHSIAWVVGTSPDCLTCKSDTTMSTPFTPGDTVIVPQYVLEQGFSLPGDGNEDLTVVDAKDIIMVCPTAAKTYWMGVDMAAHGQDGRGPGGGPGGDIIIAPPGPGGLTVNNAVFRAGDGGNGESTQ